MNYVLIRSSRRTVSVEIKDGTIIVRAPTRMSKNEIDSFVDSKKDWIESKLALVKARMKDAEKAGCLTVDELKELADKACDVIPKKVAFFASVIGVTYGRITIRAQKTRWGSCTADGNLNFNCLLMLMPDEVIDSVVVHELCHRKEMNHSARFYAEIKKVFPSYDVCRKWLKENGASLLLRLQ